ncbi:nitroreductase family protein [Streptomyces sp. NBC_00989]|uniref:nitroreductase family protein n=1 Tax=Streptomyces sp. NBC_00989 TaxID=2903705 RepID=UPI003869EB68|nr:nitroreductase family protein [Streptomyces sp. NBC_00989]
MADTFPLPATAQHLLEDLLRAYQAGPAGEVGPVPRRLRPGLPADTADSYPLPPPAPPLRSPRAVLDDRRTVRDFAPTPLPGTVLAAALTAAREHDARTAPGETQAGNGLTPVVVVRRATGFAPGVYGADPAALNGADPAPDSLNSLYRYGSLTPQGWNCLFSGPQFASAPVLILMVGSIGAAWHRHGAPGHPRLLRRAGSAAYAGWLAAARRGYGAAILGATLPSPELSATARLDPLSRRPLVALALGTAAPDPPPRDPATASVRH